MSVTRADWSSPAVEPTLAVKLFQTIFQALFGIDGGWSWLLYWLQSMGVVSVGSVDSVRVTPLLLLPPPPLMVLPPPPPPPLPKPMIGGNASTKITLPESPARRTPAGLSLPLPTNWTTAPGATPAIGDTARDDLDGPRVGRQLENGSRHVRVAVVLEIHLELRAARELE